MTAARWLRIGLTILRLMWKYRGPAWALAKDAYNTVEKWSNQWQNAGRSTTSEEKKARAMRLMKAYASSTHSPYLRAKVAVHGEETLEAVWTAKNPKKAMRRRHGKAR